MDNDADHSDDERPSRPRGVNERRLVEAWARMIEAARSKPDVPESLEDGVMQAVVGRPRRSHASSRMLATRVAAGALAASIALVVYWAGRDGARADSAPETLPNAMSDAVPVEFALQAGRAQSVRVTGSFNHWEQGIALSGPDAAGRWHASVRLPPGVHQYMFVVDGVWMVDPRADRVVDDGFGKLNGVVAVRAGAGPAS